MNRLNTLLVLMALTFALSACAYNPTTQVSEDSARQRLATRWQKFLSLATQQPRQPYRMSLSLRFGQKQDTRRVTALLWGDNADKLRLDVQAGVGVTVAKIMENAEHFLLYLPAEKKAYTYSGHSKPLLIMGTPLPLNLSNLSDLLNGYYSSVFGAEYLEAKEDREKDWGIYSLAGSLAGELILNKQGQPLYWKSQAESDWQMEIVSAEDEPQFLPQRLIVQRQNGTKILLVVKTREMPVELTAQQLALQLPPAVQKLPLEQYAKR